MIARVYSIGVNSDLGKEIVKEAEQPWISRAQRLLEPCGICEHQPKGTINFTGPLTPGSIFRLAFERFSECSPEAQARLVMQHLSLSDCTALATLGAAYLHDLIQEISLGVGVSLQPKHLLQRVHLSCLASGSEQVTSESRP